VPAPAVAVLLAALLVGNVLLALALLGRRRTLGLGAYEPTPLAGEPVDLPIELARDPDGRPAAGAGISLATYDRVVRIVSYTFLLATAVVVAAGGLRPDAAPAIYLLLLVGAGVVFLLHDVAPRVADVGTLFLIEGAAAVTFLTVLIVLTGGVSSPFFFGYFLVVAAAALVTGGGASLVLAAAITAAFLGVLLVTRGGQPYTTEQVVIVAVDVLALWLLSYLASVVAGEQRQTRDAALRLSLHDPLTGLYNRTFLFAVIEREIARAGRTNRRFSLLMLDLDGLKPINDRFGHYFGDRMLQAVAEAVRQHIRLIDSAARYGGDEFVVLLPETDTDGAAVVAEKLRRSVAAIRLNAGTDLLSSTASIGVVAFPEDGRTADALTNRADQVMYGAKRAGRNRVSIEAHAAQPVPAPASVTVPPLGRHDSRAGVGGRVRPRRDIATPTTQPGATRRRVPARRPPRVGGIASPRDARPSMFTERYPSLSATSQPRSTAWTRDATPFTTRPPGGASVPSDASADGAVATGPAAASAATSARAPTARARRFQVDHPHDRTFERTMRHFLRGDDAGGRSSAERGEHAT
jgi:diguanylate cyclase (GGDEF)-like protein